MPHDIISKTDNVIHRRVGVDEDMKKIKRKDNGMNRA